MQRLERDEALVSQDEQLIEVRREVEEKIKSKESQIAKYIASLAEMKEQLRVAQLSVKDVRNLASQVVCLVFVN